MKLKYCFSCFRDKPVEGGKIVKTSLKSIGRFKCKECLAKLKRPKGERVIITDVKGDKSEFRAA